MAILCKVLNVGQEKKIEYTVRSDQVGADVYFNDKLVGKVPSNQVLKVKYKESKSPIRVRCANVPSRSPDSNIYREFTPDTMTFILNYNRMTLSVPANSTKVSVDIEKGVMLNMVGVAKTVAQVDVSPSITGLMKETTVVTHFSPNTDIVNIPVGQNSTQIHYKTSDSIASSIQNNITSHASLVTGYDLSYFDTVEEYIQERPGVYGVYEVEKEVGSGILPFPRFMLGFPDDGILTMTVEINRPY